MYFIVQAFDPSNDQPLQGTGRKFRDLKQACTLAKAIITRARSFNCCASVSVFPVSLLGGQLQAIETRITCNQD